MKKYMLKTDKRKTINIISTFFSSLIQEPLDYLSRELNIGLNLNFLIYGQFFQDFLNFESALYQNTDGVNIALIRCSDVVNNSSVDTNTAEIFKNLLELIKVYFNNTYTPLIICFCPDRPEFYKIEEYLTASLANQKNLSIIPSAKIKGTYFKEEFFDDHIYLISNIPYTMEGFSAIALMLVRCITSIYRLPYKVIVVDCDNTLWDGVCGEDGYDGIKFSFGRLLLQKFLLREYSRGILLCICSKNNLNDVLSVFKHRSEMHLKREHFIASRINWESKTSNIMSLAEELNLGLDSFIFIDDNPIEIEEVSIELPDVLSILLPAKNDLIPNFINFSWAFDSFAISEDKVNKTSLYRQSLAREQLKSSAPTLADFIKNLKLIINITPLKEEHISRVSELSIRTNQFNLNANKWMEQVLSKLSKKEFFLIIKAKDKFGDYGLVGTVSYFIEKEITIVTSFFLSCRILGKGVEHKIISELAKIALAAKSNYLYFNYKETTRNIPAINFFNSLPYDKKTKSHYTFKARNLINTTYSPNQTVSKLENKVQYRPDIQRSQQNLELLKLSEAFNEQFDLLKLYNKLALDFRLDEKISENNHQNVILAQIFSEVLGLTKIESTKSFFELGGNSLLAIQVISRIYKILKKAISLRDFYNNPTINQLSSILTDMPLANDWGKSKANSFNYNRPYPLSLQQEGIFFIQSMSPKSCAYNISSSLKISGNLDLAVFKKAIKCILKKHPVLRTKFFLEKGIPCQVVAQEVEPKFEIRDISPVQLLEELSTEEKKAFELNIPPLFRITLFRLQKDQFILLIVTHHIVSDGWSQQLIMQDLSNFYNTCLLNKDYSKRVENNVYFKYLEYVINQRGQMNGNEFQKKIRYWEDFLSDTQPIELKTDFPKLAHRNYDGKYLAIVINRNETDQLKALAQEKTLSLYSILLSLIEIILYKQSEQTSFCISTVTACRLETPLEDVVGFFANLLPIKFDVNQYPTAIDLITSMHLQVIDMLSNQEIPYEQIIRGLKKFKPSSFNSLNNVVFAFQNLNQNLPDFKNVDISIYKRGSNIAKYDLLIELEEAEEKLIGGIYYNTSIFHKSTINQIIKNLNKLIPLILTNPKILLSEINL